MIMFPLILSKTDKIIGIRKVYGCFCVLLRLDTDALQALLPHLSKEAFD